MPLKVHSENYKNNYGQTPRGYGLWAFDLEDTSCNKVFKTVQAPRSMTYTEARKWVVNHVKENYAEELATGYLTINAAT